MLDSKGFDEWAGEYDEAIAKSKGYPFEGYYRVLCFVHKMVSVDSRTKILDLGIGTGALTYELSREGARIYGVDFSPKMLELARQKIPDGRFYLFDFNRGLPPELAGEKFNYIVSSYAFHHVGDNIKIKFIDKLKRNLMEEGKIIIGDVAFETEEDRDKCRDSSGDAWDPDEYYLVADTMIPRLEKCGWVVRYKQISSCAGVLAINRSPAS